MQISKDPPRNSVNTPSNGQVTDYQKVKLPMPREFNGKKYFGLADVAKFRKKLFVVKTLNRLMR